jgi:hypothetical protein
MIKRARESAAAGRRFSTMNTSTSERLGELTIRRVFPVHTGFFLFINLRVTDGRVGKNSAGNEY